MTTPPIALLVPRLQALLDPLVAIVALTVWLSAPVLWLSFTVSDLRLQAQAAAAQLAERLGRDFDEQPLLWRYDSLKLLQHAQPLLTGSDLAAVRLVDHTGTPLDARAADGARQGPLLWQVYPVRIGTAHGQIWVATSLRRALHTTFALLGIFGVVAAALGALLRWVPLHTARSAQARLSELWQEREASRLALQRHSEALEVEVAARTAELRAMSARAIHVQAAERQALARELHDELGQTLTGLRLRLQVAAHANPANSDNVALVDRAIEGVRRAVLSLVPASLDELGLALALQRMGEVVQDSHGISIRCSVALDGAATDAAIDLAAYRIAQEALTNVVRHSRARTATVSLDAADGALRLVVCDDGQGMGDATPRAGLTSMRERAALLGGSLQVTPAAGGGTRVEAILPLRSGEGRPLDNNR